jgi:hypothetical protein
MRIMTWSIDRFSACLQVSTTKAVQRVLERLLIPPAQTRAAQAADLTALPSDCGGPLMSLSRCGRMVCQFANERILLVEHVIEARQINTVVAKAGAIAPL